MALQKIVVTTSWQSFTVGNTSTLWLPQNIEVLFSTGVEDPTEEYEVLSPGMDNRIILKEDSTLWLKAKEESFVFLDDEITG